MCIILCRVVDVVYRFIVLCTKISVRAFHTCLVDIQRTLVRVLFQHTHPSRTSVPTSQHGANTDTSHARPNIFGKQETEREVDDALDASAALFRRARPGIKHSASGSTCTRCASRFCDSYLDIYK